MLKKLSVLIAWLIASAPAFGAIGSNITDVPYQQQVVRVCKSGPGCFTTICGATCSTTTSTCAAGSAYASFTDSGATKPYAIDVADGVYEECIRVAGGKSWVTFDMSKGAIVKPTGTVANGVLTIGGTGGSGVADHITVRGGTFHNNTTGAPEAACYVGGEVAASDTWDNVTFEDVTCIGAHDGWQSVTGAATNADDVPTFISKNNLYISGHDACTVKAGMHILSEHDACISWSNYCSASSGVVSGAVAATSGSATVTTLAGSSNNDVYVPRVLTLSNGIGTCAAAGAQAITDYVGATKVATTAAFAANPDPNCNYSIAAPPMALMAPCTDDWSSYALWKNTAFHTSSGTDPNVNARWVFNGTHFLAYWNNGIADASLSGGGATVIKFAAFPHAQTVEFNDVLIEGHLNYNSILDHTPSEGITGKVAGVLIEADTTDATESVSISGKVKIVNNGDPDVNVAGIRTFTAAVNGIGTLAIGPMVFDVSSPVGSYAGVMNDLWLGDDILGVVRLGSLSSLQNGGKLRTLLSATAFPLLAPANAPASSDIRGLQYPDFSTAGPAWAAGTDMRCALVALPDGLQPVANAQFNVGTAVAAKNVAACIYNQTFTALELTSTATSVAGTGLVTGALNITQGLGPGNHWFCALSDATVTLVLQGPPIATLGTGVAFTIDASGSSTTCPTAATLSAASKTAMATAYPEIVLTP